MPKKLNPVFSFSSPAKIWNLLTDHEARYLYLELRDEEAHQVSFAAYDLDNHKLCWDDLRFEEDWWIGMSAADAHLLVLHTYEDSDNPEVKSFFAIDNASREIVWQDSDLQVMDVYRGQLYGFVRKDTSTVYKSVSLKTKQQQNLSPEEVEHALAELSAENKYIRHPFHYMEEDTYFETVSRFVQHYLNRQPKLGCEYLDENGLIFISYYMEEDKALANYLLIVDTEGALLLHEKLDDQLSHIGLSTFMLVRNQLIFIKQKRELLSYAI